MKKPLAFILALALLLALAACGKADEPVSITSPQTEFITTDIPPTTLFIWVEEWEKPIIGESGSRRVGVKYKEVDLTKHWCGYIWNEVGIEIEPRGDLSQILGHRIETRDEAARIANEILVIEQGAGVVLGYNGYLTDAGIRHITQRKIQGPVTAAYRHGRSRAEVCQSFQTLVIAASKYYANGPH